MRRFEVELHMAVYPEAGDRICAVSFRDVLEDTTAYHVSVTIPHSD